jgi:hypothetical protein
MKNKRNLEEITSIPGFADYIMTDDTFKTNE